MKATALICDAQQRFTLEEVVLKDPGPDQIAIHTSYSGVSIGTEFALVRNKLSWGPYPLCRFRLSSSARRRGRPGFSESRWNCDGRRNDDVATGQSHSGADTAALRANRRR